MHWSRNWVRAAERESEPIETPLEEVVTRRGTGLGKVELKAACESTNLRGPKYDEQETVEEVRTDAI